MNKIRYALDQNLSKYENMVFLYQKARESKSYVYGYYKGLSMIKNIVLEVDFTMLERKLRK